MLWRALIPTWQNGLYYDYGWLVPPAAVFAFWRRYRLLRLDPNLQRNRGSQLSNLSWWKIAASALLILALLSVLGGIRAIEWAAPTWRLPLSAHAGLVCIVFHGAVAIRYGRATSLFFLPVTILCLTAVPLPSLLEIRIIDLFTRAVVIASVAVLPLIGIPAEAAGFTIQSMGDTVSVSEACSGIRSFQSLFMVSVFSGEIFFLRIPHRVLLVIVGGFLAFSMNTLRAIALAVIQFSSGSEAFDRWHDGVGHLTFLTSGLILLGLALWIDRSRHRRSVVKAVHSNKE